LVQKVPYIRMLGESPARAGFFEVNEFQAIVRELPTYLRAPLEVARMTGWRVASEVLVRKVKHLDLANGWLRLDTGETKNGEGREFPLTPALRSVLVAQRERTRALEKERGEIIPWLFHDDSGKPITSFRTAWLGACKRAGIRKLPHDLRRTAVRNLERAGVPAQRRDEDGRPQDRIDLSAIFNRRCEGARRGCDQAGGVASERSSRDAEGRDGELNHERPHAQVYERRTAKAAVESGIAPQTSAGSNVSEAGGVRATPYRSQEAATLCRMRHRDHAARARCPLPR
jgi:hypothetical protein